jgi:hypothetical protein
MRIDNYISKNAIGFYVALFLIISLALHVTEIVIGAKYKDDVICDTNVIAIPTWLIVKGLASILYVSLFCIAFVAGVEESTDLLNIVAIPIMIVGSFEFIWLIIGSVIFWRDCNDLEPQSVNTMMWCSLIIGYVFSPVHYCTPYVKRNKENEIYL